MTLLYEARRVGLKVITDGERLIVRGPQRYASLAQQLLTHKTDLLALLVSEKKGYTEPRRANPGSSTHFHQHRSRLEALLNAKYHCQKCGYNGAYDGSLEVTDALVVVCRPCSGLPSLVKPKQSDTAVTPLPTVIKLFPGYKCPSCVQALRELPDDMVGCSGGHIFERE